MIYIMGVLNDIRWIIVSYYIAIVYIIREFIGLRLGFSPRLHQKETFSQKGRLAIITGGSKGIGLEVVHELLKLGGNVIIGSSSSTEFRKKLENSLKEKYPNSEIEVWHLDLASLKSVSEFAKKFLSRKQRLHLLINNAGIMHVPTREVTEDGFERHFAVNYLSHCLLSFLLLPAMGSEENSPNARIVNTTSCVHYVTDVIKDLQETNYSKFHAYNQSKLEQVMFTLSLQFYLNKINSSVVVNCVHPGIANTELLTNSMHVPQVAAIFKSAKEGAETILYAAIAKEMENVGGKYLEDCSVVEPSKLARNVKLQNQLWQQTLQYIEPWLEGNLYKKLHSHLNTNGV